MKKMLLPALLLVISIARGQNVRDLTIYSDSLGVPVTGPDWVFYRVIEGYEEEKPQYNVKEYYKSGKLRMEGTINDKLMEKRHGQFVHYFENGKKETVENYIDGRLFGGYQEWYENGGQRLEADYQLFDKNDPGKPLLKITSFWDKSGKMTAKEGNGTFEVREVNYISSGPVKDGFMDGEWSGKGIYKNITFTEKYAQGRLVSGTSIDPDGNVHQYTKLNEQPSSRKGIDQFYKYVAKNFKTPDVEGVNGTIVLRFIVNKDGSVSDVQLLRTLHPLFDQEAVRVVSAYPDWKPGMYRGLEARTSFSLPIKIKLPD